MDHLKSLGQVKLNESIEDQESRNLKILLKSCPAWKDLQAIIDKSTNGLDQIIKGRKITLKSTISPHTISCTEGLGPPDLIEWNVNIGPPKIRVYKTLNEALRFIWTILIDYSTENTSFVDWCKDPKCPVYGKGLIVHEIWREFIKETKNLYFPDLTEFSGPNYESLVSSLGITMHVESLMGFDPITTFSSRSIPANSLVMSLNPLKGSFKSFFEEQGFIQKKNELIEIEFTPSETQISGLNNVLENQWSVSGPSKNKEDVERMMIKGLIDFCTESKYNPLIQLVIILLSAGFSFDPHNSTDLANGIKFVLKKDLINSPFKFINGIKEKLPTVFNTLIKLNPNEGYEQYAQAGEWGL